jgi:hypothetical protein
MALSGRGVTFGARFGQRVNRGGLNAPDHSTVTLFARFLGLSTSLPRMTAESLGDLRDAHL